MPRTGRDKRSVLVVDDHDIVRQAIRAVVESQLGWEISSEAVDGREAVSKAKELMPDVVIMDISMSGLNGVEATRQIRSQLPRTEVLILTMHESEKLLREALEAGARGYILKADAGRDLIPALHALAHHKPFFSPPVSEMVLEGYLRNAAGVGAARLSRTNLTARERETIQLLAEGKSNKEIAALLGISVKTVEHHRANIMHKLRLHSIGDVVRYAIRNEIVQA